MQIWHKHTRQDPLFARSENGNSVIYRPNNSSTGCTHFDFDLINFLFYLTEPLILTFFDYGFQFVFHWLLLRRLWHYLPIQIWLKFATTNLFFVFWESILQ